MHWLLILLGIVAALITLALVARGAWRRAIRSEIVAFLADAFPDVRVVSTSSATLRLEGGDFEGTQLNLANLFMELAAHEGQDSEERRRGVYDRYFNGALSQIGALSRPLAMRDVRDRLLPMLVGAEFVLALAEHGAVPQRPVDQTGLSVVYVLDHDDAVAYVTDEQREELGVTADELHEIAMSNLRPRLTEEPVRSAVDGTNLVAVKTGDAYDATRLLLVPEYLGEGEEVAACVPDRDTLVLAPIPSDADWSGLEKLARSKASDRVVSDRPFRVRRGAIERV